MKTVTGIEELISAELEIKKGVIFNTSTCCASGTVSYSILPTEDQEEIRVAFDPETPGDLMAKLGRAA